MMSYHLKNNKFTPPRCLVKKNIEFDFQTDRNSYIDLHQFFLALKFKLVKGRSYDTHKSKKAKKEQKNEEQPTEAAAYDEEDDTNLVPLLTYLNKILRSIFSNVEVYITI